MRKNVWNVDEFFLCSNKIDFFDLQALTSSDFIDDIVWNIQRFHFGCSKCKIVS